MNQREVCIPVFHVLRAMGNRWQVVSDALNQPSPLFDTPQDACYWAIVRATPVRGRVLVENTPVDIEKGRSTSCSLHGARRHHDSLVPSGKRVISA